VLGLASQFMTFATLYGFTPIVAKRLGATDFQVGLLLMLFILPSGISSFLSGALNKRFGTRAVMSACFTLFAVDCLLTPFAGGVIPLLIMTVIGGFAQGAAFSLLMGLIVRRILPEKRNTAMGFFQAVYGLGMFLGPVIVGLFSDYLSISWGFAFTALVGIVSAGLSLRLAR